MTDATGLLQPIRSFALRAGLAALALVLALGPAAPATPAQEPQDKKPQEQGAETKDAGDEPAEGEPGQGGLSEKVTVTATRTKERTFDVPQPVAVIDRAEIAEKNPNSATDLMRELPGVDVNGVGTNQPRPLIRGQRGQRILLLEDGIRLNNPRRESDFGELAAIVDVTTVEQIEVVRGPASVLYGSDAIGGAVNSIGITPAADRAVAGSFALRYSTADSQSKGMLNLNGTVGKFNYLFNGIYRDSSSYDAPSGSYGEITLDRKTEVENTGVQDETYGFRVGYRPAEGHEVFVRAERYRADESGFGFVDPAAYGQSGETLVRLLYPYQDVDKYSVGYRATNMDTAWANSVEATIYRRDNEREFSQDIFIPFFGSFGLSIVGTNYTEVQTTGLRFEANKLFGRSHVLTYGLDWYEDEIYGTNVTITDFNFDEDDPEVDETPTVPNATWSSWGLFVQDQWKATDRFSVIAGARHQSTTADPEPTPNLDPDVDYRKSDDSATVGSLNFLYAVTDEVKVVLNVGSGFRSPNMVERFFGGLTPDGSAEQIPAPDLSPEKSVNVDLGLKYRRRNVAFELSVFQNDIEDGIRIACFEEDPDGNCTVDPDSELELVQYKNVEELRYRGAEVGFNWNFWGGFSLGLNYTHLTGDNRQTGSNVNESYSDKTNFLLRYDARGGRWWAEYVLRRNGEQSDVDFVTAPAVGPVIPAFTVHALRGGVVLARTESMTHRLGLAVENLTDALYAEFTNASFFRPEPERSYVFTYRMDF